LFGHGEDFMSKLADPKSCPFVLVGSSGETERRVNPVVCPSPRQMSTSGLEYAGMGGRFSGPDYD